MRIGLVIYGSLETLSGGYLYDRKLVEYLQASGDEVQVISLPWRNYAAHLSDNLRFRLPAGLDLLIEDELNHPSLLAANRRPHSYPIISLVHHLRSSEKRMGWQNAFYKIVERGYLASADGFIFNSRTTCDVVHQLAGTARPHLVAYPPTDRFGKGLTPDLVLSRAAEPGPLRLLFLGSVIPRKGLHILLSALSLLPDSQARLEVVGPLDADAAYAAAMRRRVETGGLGLTVQFHGPLDSEGMREILRSAHLLVLPSSYEGFGIAYLEGMAFGLPAIATTSGAASEIITDGVDGYLVPPDDADLLAARLVSLAEDRALLAQMSLNALERYRRQPRWEETGASIRQFLLRLVSQKLT